MFSLELPEDVSIIKEYAFSNCLSLRNVALPVSAEVEHCAFFCCGRLRQIDGVLNGGLMTSDESLKRQQQITDALKHRFDKLPIHKMIYYQSYNNVTADSLRIADSTGNQRDRLGMTPLHIMACSSVQNIELYKVLVEKYPENLITEDSWGGLPILYAVWGGVPKDILLFLIGSYQSLYPDYEFNWTLMVESLLSGLQEETVYKLLDIQQRFFPNQIIDWEDLLNKAVTMPCETNNFESVKIESFRIILQCRMMKSVREIGLKQWRDEITDAIGAFHDLSKPKMKLTIKSCMKRRTFIQQIKTKIIEFEVAYIKLKESIVLLELALWKKRMSEYALEQNEENNNLNQSMDRLGLDEEETSQEKCRISCGSDIVIEHVLPYLVPIQR